MALQHIVLYECDSPACSNRGGAHEVKYHGKFPKGWLHIRAAIWPNIEQGQRGGMSFCSAACLQTALTEGTFINMNWKAGDDDVWKGDAPDGQTKEV